MVFGLKIKPSTQKTNNKPAVSLFEEKVVSDNKQYISSLSDLNAAPATAAPIIIPKLDNTWSIEKTISEKPNNNDKIDVPVASMDNSKDVEMNKDEKVSCESKQNNETNQLTAEDQARLLLKQSVNPSVEVEDVNMTIPAVDSTIQEDEKGNQSQLYKSLLSRKNLKGADILDEINSKPEEPDVLGDGYADIPIEQFGFALLRGLGYHDDGRVGKDKKICPVIQTSEISYRSGLGADTTKQRLSNSGYLKVDSRVGITSGNYEGFIASVINVKQMNTTGQIIIRLDNGSKEELQIHKQHLKVLDSAIKLKSFLQEYENYSNNRQLLNQMNEQISRNSNTNLSSIQEKEKEKENQNSIKRHYDSSNSDNNKRRHYSSHSHHRSTSTQDHAHDYQQDRNKHDYHSTSVSNHKSREASHHHHSHHH